MKFTKFSLFIIRIINRIKSIHFFAFLFFILTSTSSIGGSIPVTISDKDINELHFWKGANVEILEDLNNNYTIEDIISGKYDKNFYKDKVDVPITKKLNTAYWARIKILKKSKDKYNWVFEAYDQSIDEIYFYAPDESGKYIRFEGGDNKPFETRQYQHKNYVFDLNLETNKEQIIYIKIKSAHRTSFIGVVRNVHSYIAYALKEYFYLALFYGLVLSMIIFNLMQYFVTRLKIYFVYVLYIISAATYSATQDGLGFQFLWSDIYEINNFLQYISSFFVISLFLLLAQQFIKDLTIDVKIIQLGASLIIIRLLLFILIISGINLFPIFIFDLIIRIIIFAFFIKLYYDGNRQLRYFTLAVLTLAICYSIRELTINGLFPNTVITVYFNLLGESLQILFISLGLGDRLKIKMETLVESQEKSLIELEQTHLKTEKLRKNLQQRVEEQIAREKYVSGGISDLSIIITSYLNDTDQLYKKITKFIAEYFECHLTALYMLSPGKNYVELSSGYGLDEMRLDGLKIEEGNGLIGQCLINKERIEMHQLPEGYISISSGLGQTIPKLIIIEPLTFNTQLVGVIELASLKEFTPLQYELLDKFTAQIASSLSNVMFNDATKNLLDESMQKEIMLRQQEEEMRQQLEELMATQEEFTRKEEDYLKEIAALKKKK